MNTIPNPAAPAATAASTAPERSHRVIRAEGKVPLGTGVLRHRGVGRIGGLVGYADPAALSRLAHALGADAQILWDQAKGFEQRLVVDWDCCWFDGKQVSGLDQWYALLSGQRLGSVEGAFALAWLSPDGTLNLARDALGERKLYYAPSPDGVVFASAIPALLASGLVPCSLWVPAVVSYLTYAYVPGRET